MVHDHTRWASFGSTELCVSFRGLLVYAFCEHKSHRLRTESKAEADMIPVLIIADLDTHGSNLHMVRACYV